MKRDAGGDTNLVARQPAMAIADTVSEEDMAKIQALGDGSATPDDIFAFRMVASGDGLDYYFTRQAESSMQNFARDLQKGQSVLGSHDVNTFSYGSSYDGAVVKADPLGPEYEAAFYRQYSAKPELATTHYVTGKFYLVRGVELNGQKTDDLIRSMKMGGVRKASVSFTVGKYVCGIDGVDMMASFFGPWPDESNGCQHFPGVEYKKEGVAWAWMEGNDLMETSLVYKNASPSAMFLRKAEELAQRGMLPTGQRAPLEERLQMRLPNHDRQLWPVTKQEDRKMDPENTNPAGDPPADPPEDPPVADPPVEPPADPPAAQTEPDAATLGDAGRQAIARVRSIDARDAEIQTILGGPVTVEAIRSLKRNADLGTALWGTHVDEAVKARVAAQGEGFDAAKYRSLLLSSNDVEFVSAEIESYGAQKRKVWGVGRTVEPIEDSEPDRSPSSESTGLLGGVQKKTRMGAGAATKSGK